MRRLTIGRIEMEHSCQMHKNTQYKQIENKKEEILKITLNRMFNITEISLI